eukprot:3311511-Pyramimonas_sp.AAC.1
MSGQCAHRAEKPAAAHDRHRSRPELLVSTRRQRQDNGTFDASRSRRSGPRRTPRGTSDGAHFQCAARRGEGAGTCHD